MWNRILLPQRICYPEKACVDKVRFGCGSYIVRISVRFGVGSGWFLDFVSIVRGFRFGSFFRLGFGLMWFLFRFCKGFGLSSGLYRAQFGS